MLAFGPVCFLKCAIHAAREHVDDLVIWREILSTKLERYWHVWTVVLKKFAGVILGWISISMAAKNGLISELLPR